MLLDDMADYASSQGHGTIGTNLFKGALPSTPDACVAILGPYGAAPPVRAMAGSAGQALAERPRVQVIARDTRYDAAQKKAQDLWFSLDGVQARSINGVAYQSIFSLQQPFYLERDANNREVFAFNVEVIRSPATSS